MASAEASDPWRTRFQEGLRLVLGEERATLVLPAEVDESREYTAKENVWWTGECLSRLEGVASNDEAHRILMSCSHQLPEERVEVLRAFYQHHQDVDELMEFWRSQFIYHLKRWHPQLRPEWIDAILDEGWGEVGVRVGEDVLATKVPKDIQEFFEAEDERDRAFRYCHCDRIRGAFQEGCPELPSAYCYCGAGFYKLNWERVLGREVQVRLESSLLQGDRVCRFRIALGPE